MIHECNIYDNVEICLEFHHYTFIITGSLKHMGIMKSGESNETKADLMGQVGII